MLDKKYLVKNMSADLHGLSGVKEEKHPEPDDNEPDDDLDDINYKAAYLKGYEQGLKDMEQKMKEKE